MPLSRPTLALVASAAALAAAFAALPAAAQADDTDGPIVVTGQKDIEKQIQSFVGALTPAPPRGQIGRFETAICPRVVGLADAQRAIVEARMRLVVGKAGLDVGKPDCAANLLVVVTPDKAAFLKALGRDHAYLFGNRSPGEVRKILAQPGSAAAWQVEGTLNADGHPVMLEQGIPVNRTGRSPSRITAAARPYVAGAVVVIDSRALDGFTTTQVADYALMRAVSRVDPARLDASAAPTILRALDAAVDEEVPVTLTQWDFTFLKGLYSGANNLYAPSQRSEIGRVMEREMGADASEDDNPKG